MSPALAPSPCWRLLAVMAGQHQRLQQRNNNTYMVYLYRSRCCSNGAPRPTRGLWLLC